MTLSGRSVRLRRWGLSFYSPLRRPAPPRWVLLSLPKYIGKIKGTFLYLHYDFLDMCKCW